VRRAVGATRADIMRQFFAEALMIVAMGAALGLLLSLGLVTALGGLPIKEFVGVPTISAPVLVATLSLLAIVAFAAGLLPAGARRRSIRWRRCAPDVLHPAARIHRRPEDAAHPGVPHLLCGDLGDARGRIAAGVRGGTEAPPCATDCWAPESGSSWCTG